jgi:hypothetical protein
VIAYCVDVGSIAGDRFAWARCDLTRVDEPTSDTQPDPLVESLNVDLQNAKVALGFECPLFVPVRDDPSRLAAGRDNEGRRPWSAGGGVCSMGTGLVQSIWVFRKLRLRLEESGRQLPSAFLTWPEFEKASSGILVWEAFVSEGGKVPGDHADSDRRDAVAGLTAFRDALPDPASANSIREERVHSLIGGVLLSTGWSEDIELLSEPCIVIRAPSRSDPTGPRGVSA